MLKGLLLLVLGFILMPVVKFIYLSIKSRVIGHCAKWALLDLLNSNDPLPKEERDGLIDTLNGLYKLLDDMKKNNIGGYYRKQVEEDIKIIEQILNK